MAAQRKMGLIIAVVVVVVLIFSIMSWFVSTRNTLVSMDEEINAAWAEIDNQLQRRSDLIPNLVNTVKGFASQEKEIFTDIADARARLAGAQSVGEKAESYNQLEGALPAGRLHCVRLYETPRNFVEYRGE